MQEHEVRRLSRARRTVSITYRSAGRPVRGRTTTYAFDGANQLVSSTAGGVTTKYAYDAAGRLVREGDRAYRYGYLDKVLSVTEGKRKLTYTYHVDGQLARADYGDGRAEDFAWDGLALVWRGGESFICEPHVGGGNPIASSEGTAYLNDMLGTTVAAKSGRRCSAAVLTAFGEPLPGAGGGAFFTGKPQVEGLGYAFLYRNYRASLAKWQTADYAWSATVTINYSDVFEDPLDIGIEAPFSKAYSYYHTWNHNVLVGTGTITIGPVEIE